MKKLISIVFLLIISTTAFGASLKGTADALGQEAIKIGIALGVFAIVRAGISIAMGKPDGGEQMSKAVFGIGSVMLVMTIIATLKTITQQGA
jgi:uncharacterized membrane protein